MRLGAIILSGGASSRMGADKAQLLWLGQRAVDRIVRLAGECGSELVVTAGSNDYGYPYVADDILGGGPVGGILAGARVLHSASCRRALILAVDAPMVERSSLVPLLQAEPPGAAFEHLHLPIVLDLSAIPEEAVAGWPIARLIERAGLLRIPCPMQNIESMRGANTPEERQEQLRCLK